MPLENITLIKLQRSEFAGPLKLFQRETVNTTDGIIYSIFEQAKQQLNRSSAKRFGFFDSAAENQQLLGQLKLWLTEKSNFLNLANKASEYLQQQLDQTEDVIEAVLIFAHETILDQPLLYCFWLPFTESIQIGHDLAPVRSQSINVSDLQYAFRLQINEWQTGDSSKYLTLLNQRGNKELGDAFKQFCNFSEGIDLPKQTNDFLQILDRYSDDIEQTVSVEQAKTVKLAVLNYCVEKDKIGEAVLLQEISAQIDKDSPTKFVDYVKTQQHTQKIPEQNEIHTDRQSLKRYMRYFGRDQSLSISFSAERFGTDIQYDPKSGSLNILKLPKNLKVQLSGYAEKKS